MRTIEKKVWPEFFQAILDGRKTFELRLNDFEVSEGDKLVLKEWDPETKQYSGRQIEKIVTYIAKVDTLKFWSKEEIDKHGFQILGFK